MRTPTTAVAESALVLFASALVAGVALFALLAAVDLFHPADLAGRGSGQTQAPAVSAIATAKPAATTATQPVSVAGVTAGGATSVPAAAASPSPSGPLPSAPAAEGPGQAAPPETTAAESSAAASSTEGGDQAGDRGDTSSGG